MQQHQTSHFCRYITSKPRLHHVRRTSKIALWNPTKLPHQMGEKCVSIIFGSCSICWSCKSKFDAFFMTNEIQLLTFFFSISCRDPSMRDFNCYICNFPPPTVNGPTICHSICDRSIENFGAFFHDCKLFKEFHCFPHTQSDRWISLSARKNGKSYSSTHTNLSTLTLLNTHHKLNRKIEKRWKIFCTRHHTPPVYFHAKCTFKFEFFNLFFVEFLRAFHFEWMFESFFSRMFSCYNLNFIFFLVWFKLFSRIRQTPNKSFSFFMFIFFSFIFVLS